MINWPFRLVHGDQGAGTPESLHFNFAVLKAATGNFCEENKLGQGGFGPVYWVLTASIIDKINIVLLRFQVAT